MNPTALLLTWSVMIATFFKVSITLFSAITENWFWSLTRNLCRNNFNYDNTTFIFWILNVRNYNTKIPPMKSLDVVEMEAREDQS